MPSHPRRPGPLAGQPEAAWETLWYHLLPRWLAQRGVLLQVTPRRLDETAGGDQATVNLFSLYQIGRIDRNVPRVIWGEAVELDELEVQAPLRLIHLGQPSEQLLPFADHELAMLRMPPAEAELAYANLIIYAPSLMKSEEADIAFFAGGFAQNPQTRELAHQAWPAFSEGFLRLAREGRKIDARQYA